jgi:hypothetical protein
LWKVHPQQQESSCWWKSSCHQECEKFIHNYRRAASDESHEECEKFIHNFRRAAADGSHLVTKNMKSSSTTTGEHLLMKGIFWWGCEQVIRSYWRTAFECDERYVSGCELGSLKKQLVMTGWQLAVRSSSTATEEQVHPQLQENSWW